MTHHIPETHDPTPRHLRLAIAATYSSVAIFILAAFAGFSPIHFAATSLMYALGVAMAALAIWAGKHTTHTLPEHTPVGDTQNEDISP